MSTSSTRARDKLKRAAAERAVEEVEPGMILGLGSGTTAAFAVELLARRVAQGLRVQAIPTSEKTAALARRLGIPLSGFDQHRRIDLTIDGADEVERRSLHLIKGLGGALLREKIVAAASDRMIVIVDNSKLVDRLGTHVPLPVEIVPFGWQTALDRLAEIRATSSLRRVGDAPVTTDGGNYIADCAFAAGIADPAALERRLALMVGVVESGLFVSLASEVIVGGPSGVSVIGK